MAIFYQGGLSRLTCKPGTTGTLEALAFRESVMALADERYLDWPVLPQAPSSLVALQAGKLVKMTWEVAADHAGANGDPYPAAGWGIWRMARNCDTPREPATV